MKRVQVHEKTDKITDENVPVEKRFRKLMSVPHVKVGDGEVCDYPAKVKAELFGEDGSAVTVTQDSIDKLINEQHTCICNECDIMRLAKFLTERKGREVFVITVR